MTIDIVERSNAIEALGYTPRQAAFLALVVRHGGYCLRRQYAAFVHGANGQAAADFLDRVAHRGHARRLVLRRDRGFVYHLYASAVYDLLGLPDSRHRRPASPPVIVRRLMTVDAVLAQREATCLATEGEKIDYFTTVRHVPAYPLPTADAHAEPPKTSATTPRYFVERQPIWITPDDPTVQFGYLALEPPADGFRDFLARHARLFAALPSVRLVLVTPKSAAYVRLYEGRVAWARDPAALAFEPGRRGVRSVRQRDLLRYFDRRWAWEHGDHGRFTRAELDAYRHDLARFGGPQDLARYVRWCASRVAGEPTPAVPDVATAGPLLTVPLPVTVLRLPFSYDFAGDFPGVA